MTRPADESASAGGGSASIIPPAETAHAEDIATLLDRLGGSSSDGLTPDRAERRLARFGRNELPEAPRKPDWLRFVEQFKDPLVLTLLVAAVVATVVGVSERADAGILARFGDAIAIMLIVIMNAIIGYYQERRAEAALDALQRLTAPTARVRRGGEVVVLSAAEVVPGDLLELEAGDAIAADARLVQTLNLGTEESALTGESSPVGKDAKAPVPEHVPLAERQNMVFTGTMIVRGKGRAVVTATGIRTELGRIGEMMRSIGDQKTPLEERLEKFGAIILKICLGLSAVLMAWGFIRGDRSWHALLLEAVSLAVAAIPEGLPAITTITLALGMQRMAKRGAIVRKLPAVETLGAATVICSDKTGTLTQNEMMVRCVCTSGRIYRVTGQGYDPHGEINDPDKQAIDPNHIPRALDNLLATAALCNNAEVERDRESGQWKVIGDPTEGALLTLAAKAGREIDALSSSNIFVTELPFDSDRKRMTVVTRDEFGREMAHVKGSVDVLLPRCSHVETDDGVQELTDELRTLIMEQAEGLGEDALRVLALCRREAKPAKGAKGEGSDPYGNGIVDEPSHWPERASITSLDDVHRLAGPMSRRGLGGPEAEDPPAPAEAEQLESGLIFQGMVGMTDPPRLGVEEAVGECAAAGIRAVMITGDHKLTATSIAKEIGLWEPGDESVTGSELAEMSEEELNARVMKLRVFARTTAEQKLNIVRAFKRQGHIVAMTGDGVNDAPALKESHIGVAMGLSGTDVAREAADLVLADDNFATIVDAVREGRAIYRNIQKFIFFLLSANMGLVVAVFTVSIFGSWAPLTPLMILWINLVTNGLPALALGIDPPDKRLMEEPPRPADEGLLVARDYFGIAYVGTVMGAAAVALYVTSDQDPESMLRTRALAFSLLALSPLMHALSCRNPIRSMFASRPAISIPLAIAMATSAAIHLVAILVPALRPVFRTFPMTAVEWVWVLGLGALVLPAMEIAKVFYRRQMARLGTLPPPSSVLSKRR